MSLYFFHVRNDIDTVDEEGQELPDLAAARRIAIESARLLICECVKRGVVTLDHCIDVTDEQGTQLFTLDFRDAFEIRGELPAIPRRN